MEKTVIMPLVKITKKQAETMDIPFPVATRLASFYNDHLYVDGPILRSRVGMRDTQVALGLTLPRFSHLSTIAKDTKDPLHYRATSILASLGYMMALGQMDAVVEQLLAVK